jgi:hypothetical protein
MNISEQVQEIMTSNGERIKALFSDASRRAKLYKRAQNLWTCDVVEERALEALLAEALTRHLESRSPQATVVAREFYAMVVRGRPSEGVEIQVLHPMSHEAVLSDSYEPVQRMIDSAFGAP